MLGVGSAQCLGLASRDWIGRTMSLAGGNESSCWGRAREESGRRSERSTAATARLRKIIAQLEAHFRPTRHSQAAMFDCVGRAEWDEPLESLSSVMRRAIRRPARASSASSPSKSAHFTRLTLESDWNNVFARSRRSLRSPSAECGGTKTASLCGAHDNKHQVATRRRRLARAGQKTSCRSCAHEKRPSCVSQ